MLQELVLILVWLGSVLEYPVPPQVSQEKLGGPLMQQEKGELIKNVTIFYCEIQLTKSFILGNLYFQSNTA